MTLHSPPKSHGHSPRPQGPQARLSSCPHAGRNWQLGSAERTHFKAKETGLQAQPVRLCDLGRQCVLGGPPFPHLSSGIKWPTVQARVCCRLLRRQMTWHTLGASGAMSTPHSGLLTPVLPRSQQIPELAVILLHLLQRLGIDLLLQVFCCLAVWRRWPLHIFQSCKGRAGRAGDGVL